MSSVSSQTHHRLPVVVLSQAAWYLVRQFAGIYGVKMDYTKIKSLSRDKITRAYFTEAKLPRFVSTITYSISGVPEKAPEIKSQAWIALILKTAAGGHKNRKFYETLAGELARPKKRKCLCGLHMGSEPEQIANHFSTKHHVNRMLGRVSPEQLSNYLETVQITDDRFLVLLRPHIPQISGHVFHFPYFIESTIDITPYMMTCEKVRKARDYTYNDIFMDLRAGTIMVLPGP
jgi:hypothetical protein